MTEITNALTGESHASPEMPPSPIGEAAALVARLLSESDQPARVEADAPATVPPEPPPEVRDSIPPSCPSIPLLADQSERAVAHPPSGRARLPYSKTTITLILIVLAILIFGSGLAVGYAILGRHFKVVSKSTVQGNDPPAVRNSGTSDALDDQTSANAADAPPVIPAVNSAEPAGSTVASAHAQVLDKGNEADLQTPPAQMRGEQSEQPHATDETPHISADSSVLDKRTVPVQPDPGISPATPPVTKSPPPPSPSVAETRTFEPSAQTSHPERPTNSVRPGYVLPAARAPQIPLETALPAIIVGPSDPHPISDMQPRAPTQAPVTSVGHIEPSQLIHSEQPVYPQQAKKLHIEGDVQLRIVVAVDGTVRSVNLVSGPPLLASAAMDAARQFRYKPAMLNGKPIETVQTIDMSFNLKN